MHLAFSAMMFLSLRHCLFCLIKSQFATVNNYVFFVNHWQTINLKTKGQKGRITDRYGNSGFQNTIADAYKNSGLQFTSQINLTRGVTIENFADVRVGVNILLYQAYVGCTRKRRNKENKIK